jgi:hypothetical protein
MGVTHKSYDPLLSHLIDKPVLEYKMFAQIIISELGHDTTGKWGFRQLSCDGYYFLNNRLCINRRISFNVFGYCPASARACGSHLTAQAISSGWFQLLPGKVCPVLRPT